jgi:glycosyltransferase involved in cell wall biosynthesis
MTIDDYELKLAQSQFGKRNVVCNTGHEECSNEILVSIVTVTYNADVFLSEAIQSVIRQDYPHIEYIVIDGASTDSTIEIIRKNDEHIDVWLSERDKGIYDAINKGISLASGELVKLLHADDLLCHDGLSKAVEVYRASKNKRLITRGYTVEIDANGNHMGITTGKEVSAGFDCFNHPSWLVPKDVYKEVGLHDTQFKISSDYELYLRLKAAGVDFVDIDSPVVKFRRGGVSSGFEGTFEVARINLTYFGRARAIRIFIIHFGGKMMSKVFHTIRNGLLRLKRNPGGLLS